MPRSVVEIVDGLDQAQQTGRDQVVELHVVGQTDGHAPGHVLDDARIDVDQVAAGVLASSRPWQRSQMSWWAIWTISVMV